MMKSWFSYWAVPVLAMALSACGDKGGSSTGNPADSLGTDSAAQALSWEKNGIHVSALTGSPEFPDAALSITQPEAHTDLVTGKQKFQFSLQGYTLGTQTEGADKIGINNSDKGQHIHLILNNEPYSAHYSPEAEVDLKEGHYVLLSFLSRSWHESVKSPKAFSLRQFVVGQPKEYKELDLNAPHLFYSRPKGEYAGPANTQRILLDFFLVNCQLSRDGWKVRLSVDGIEFMLPEWRPYVIEGLSMGEHLIKLELLDKDNVLVPGPYNKVERTITLKESADPGAPADPHAHH